MANNEQGRLIILSGPSCVGKSPLDRALAKLHPDIRGGLRPLVLYNSRSPRPAERDGVDYHFRTREYVEGLRGDPSFAVMDVRGDLQALDVGELKDDLCKGDVFFEGNPFIGRLLQTSPSLSAVSRLSVFMAPLSRGEILFLRDPERDVNLEELVADVMRRKLLRRTQRQKGLLSKGDLETIERRCRSAYGELKEACHFQYVIPNHDGEDSENWDAFYYPLGDAGRSLGAFVALLNGEESPFLEQWEHDLLR